jgi:endonuclease-3
VGRKTANLVLVEGFKRDAICVDTHVHRISNRIGYVRTKTPDQTEMALRRKLPRRHWIRYNELLVAFGQVICRPVSPFCSRCPVAAMCVRVGVERSR